MPHFFLLHHRQDNRGWSGASHNHTLEFSKRDLRVSSHTSTDRLEEDLLELKSTVYCTATRYRNLSADRWISLIGDVVWTHSNSWDAPVLVTFHPLVQEVFSDELLGKAYSRLHLSSLLGIDSKYSVTLYALGQIMLHDRTCRGKDGIPVEHIPLAEVRTRLGLEDGKWNRANDILRLLQTAAAEVSALSLTMRMTVEPQRRESFGRAVPTRGKGAAILGYTIRVHPRTMDEIMQPDLFGLSDDTKARVERILPARETYVDGVRKHKLAVGKRAVRAAEKAAQSNQARASEVDAKMAKLTGVKPSKDTPQTAVQAPVRRGMGSHAESAAARKGGPNSLEPITDNLVRLFGSSMSAELRQKWAREENHPAEVEEAQGDAL
jgi:hypothetical protein